MGVLMVNISKMAMNKSRIELKKPSGTIAIKCNFPALQRKLYDCFLFVAQEELKKNPKKNYFQVSLSSICEFLNINISGGQNFKEVKNQIYELMKIIIEYNILEKDKIIEGKATALNDIEFHIPNRQEGTIIHFTIPRRVKEAILSKNGIFGIIDLVVIRNLKSKYAIILYELLKDYEKTEIPEMDLTTFKKLFGVENKYKLFQNLKMRVLEPAVKEINESEHINWEVSYKLYKTGGKYTHIKFLKKKKPIMKQLEQQKEKKVESAKVQAFISLVPEKYRNKALEKYLFDVKDKYEFDYIEAQIKYANSKNPENYLAYLKTAIKEDYANYEEHKKQDEQAKKEFQEFFAKAQKIYKEKVLPKRDDIKLEDYLRDFIYHHFTKGKITEKQKDLYLEFWKKLYGNNA